MHKELALAAKIGMFYEFLWNRQDQCYGSGIEATQELNTVIEEFEERFEDILNPEKK